MIIQTVPFPPNVDLKRQSVEVPGTKRPGQTGHMRNAVWPLLDQDAPGAVKTLDQIFQSGLEQSRDKPFTGYRPIVSTNPLVYAKQFVWQTYAQVDVKRRAIGSALDKFFREGTVGGGDLPAVGIWSQNRPEWQHIDIAVQSYKKVSVALYDTLGADSVEYIIKHAHLSIVFAAAQHIPTLLSLGPRIPMVKVIVSIDDLTAETRRIFATWAKAHNITIFDLKEVEAIGAANLIDPIPATADQLTTICYTSGTTNTPKGALLTHGQLAVSAHSCLHGTTFVDTGILLSYLPLAHIYERIAELLVICLGGQIGYFTGDPLRLLEDAAILRPTYFPSVPRVLNRVYQAATQAGSAPGLKGTLFRKACETKLKILHETGSYKHPFWDRLVFRKIQAVLGGRLEVVTTGSAPIGPDALNFLRIALACQVIEGYGMTEDCGTCTRTWTDDPSYTGTIGPPQPCNEIKLVDVAAMNYTSEDKPYPRGELCVRGPNCFLGYYKDPKNTAETLDSEGWLHTGDVAALDDYGRFKIIDRIKNIMKLSQGEYVALEKVENAYSTTPGVAQIYVHGDSLRDHLVAIVVPDPVEFASLASKTYGKKITPEDGEELEKAAKDDNIKKVIQGILDNEARKSGLKGFETVKRIHLSLEPFTSENNLLTPTFKIRRRDAQARYKSELEALYAASASKL